MTDHKPTRGEILRPLHLVGIALACGVFAAVVTMVSTGAFTSRVQTALARGTYTDLPPISLGLIVGGIAFIVTLLGLAMLMLAVNPADVTKTIDRPVLYDADDKKGAKVPSAAAESAQSDASDSDAPDADEPAGR
ncbi:hypothetical protein QF046_002377 [Microbacterium sp. W4I4]|uniref:hypothetical protein n=1 Tax=Microbacterium sp. W4I4 TaxID=3042295 RepID=UPI0027816DA9|nr:hypothetical protein [Microbacterium sp. W4I4]MDQ0614736.1 hypothetical protein [Microbacterium sp. W4I4]